MVIAVVLGTAFLFNELFKKLNLPPVVGQILGGLLLGIPLLRELIFQGAQATAIVDLLATLGILFLLLLVGFEIDIEKIRQSSKDAILISLCAAIVIALLALNHGLITQEVFSALVAMAIVTTLVFPFVLQREIKRNPAALT